MQLCFYKENYHDAITNYLITEEQLRYTGAPKDAVALAQEEPERYPILAMENNQLVTFFVLHPNEGVKPYTENEKAILVRAFSTDYRHQGKGYAKLALQLLPNFVRENFPEINEIVLAVNLQNVAAQELYKKSGFVDEGRRTMGRKGVLIVMSYYL
ncbi:GNAT family N-acetyltransferase [Caldibacillus lycopersici]|uniref:GNAT family N-acetyltransferase n=1 Tax=Perspicuibacillus lycopersici TaxID=1325689 RepID=A0AAE3ITM6_9BACI|nr:GNAT family N-acetyltransferase [Perspicuibacillus lycopersici]MCU9613251.1 GNAT family N-acetyltransferase [Perspicuibacillus lycopersici]